VAEPDEPVSEIKGVCLLGFLAVVITPEECGGELTGELGMLKRLLAASDFQEALGDRTASGTAFTGASDLERLQIGVFGTHMDETPHLAVDSRMLDNVCYVN
jgi:hypothetical protein